MLLESFGYLRNLILVKRLILKDDSICLLSIFLPRQEKLYSASSDSLWPRRRRFLRILLAGNILNGFLLFLSLIDFVLTMIKARFACWFFFFLGYWVLGFGGANFAGVYILVGGAGALIAHCFFFMELLNGK